MKAKESVYLETTIPSYATAKPSTDIIVAARQLLTNLFWEKERHKYNSLWTPSLVTPEYFTT